MDLAFCCPVMADPVGVAQISAAWHFREPIPVSCIIQAMGCQSWIVRDSVLAVCLSSCLYWISVKATSIQADTPSKQRSFWYTFPWCLQSHHGCQRFAGHFRPAGLGGQRMQIASPDTSPCFWGQEDCFSMQQWDGAFCRSKYSWFWSTNRAKDCSNGSTSSLSRSPSLTRHTGTNKAAENIGEKEL